MAKKQVSQDDINYILAHYEEFEKFAKAKKLNDMWNGKKRNCDVYPTSQEALLAFLTANPKYSKADGRMSLMTPIMAYSEWLWSPYEGGDIVKEVKELLG